MSSRMFEDFVDQLAADGQLQEALYGLADDDGMVPMSEVMDFAAERGYEFQVEDISDELTDEQLEAIAGGWKVATFPKVEIDLAGSTLDSKLVKIDLQQGLPYLKFY